jgi:hypothetical protein
MARERSAPSFHHILDGLETALRDVRRVVIPNASYSSNFENAQAFERAAADVSCVGGDGGTAGFSSANLRQSARSPFCHCTVIGLATRGIM